MLKQTLSDSSHYGAEAHIGVFSLDTDKKDILRVLCHSDFMSNKDLRLFAVWCARQVQHLMKDERSIIVLDVAERYAHSLATDEELSSAYKNAAINARRDVCGAAYATANSNPRIAALDAAIAACESSYKYAYAMAWADDSPANPAVFHVKDASRNAFRKMLDSQIDKLLEFFTARENNQEFDWK